DGVSPRLWHESQKNGVRHHFSDGTNSRVRLPTPEKWCLTPFFSPPLRRAPRDVGDDRLRELERGDAVAAGHDARAVMQDRVEERLGLGEERVALVEAPPLSLQRLALVPAA